MASLGSVEAVLDRLRGEYPPKRGCHDGGEIEFTLAIEGEIMNRGLMVSKGMVYLRSENSICHLEGSCVAAHFVTMVAKKRIDLGSEAMDPTDSACRIFAPSGLTLIADVVVIGRVDFLPPFPKVISVVCRRLVFLQGETKMPSLQAERLIEGLVNKARIEVKCLTSSKESDTSGEEEGAAAGGAGGAAVPRK